MIDVVFYILVVLVSYVIGSVNNAYIIAYFKGVDLRKQGSGNLGTMNITRTLGQKWGWLTLALDVLKSVIPCLLGWWILGGKVGFDINGKNGLLGLDSGDKLGLFVAGISVVVGHIFPVFFKFKGGKGIATIIGVMLVANTLATVVAFVVGLIFIKITNVGSITSFVVIGLPMIVEGYLQRLYYHNTTVSILIFVLFLIAFFAHYKNISKLFRYAEQPVVVKMPKAINNQCD
ncbi:MAG: glycerol-3-phosphate acyltransferase [Clostridiales bacterium]|nr:glycerol-3-phosphate acyltransferase [Clostridiales bacterium]